MSYRLHYQPRSGYYDFDALVLTLSFLYLNRIKSIEQSKLYNPGELGKLIGYDRIPEVKKLRGMIKELTGQNQSRSWGESLSRMWIEEQVPELYYVDDHVQVYHGYLAELGKKHVSRQRLCLPGMMEFWVNSSSGLPFFFVTGEVNEKMIDMLEVEIIPQLLQLQWRSRFGVGFTRKIVVEDLKKTNFRVLSALFLCAYAKDASGQTKIN